MKKTFIQVITVVALLMFAPHASIMQAKADDGLSSVSSDISNVEATVVGVMILSENYYVYTVRQVTPDGIAYYSYSSNSALGFNINDQVMIAIQKTSKGKIIVRDIVRK